MLGVVLVCTLCVTPMGVLSQDHSLSKKNDIVAFEVNNKTEPNDSTSTRMRPEMFQEVCEPVPDDMRFDCAPGGNEQLCTSRGCCWKAAKTSGAPYCYYPPKYGTFRFVNMSENKNGVSAWYSRARPSGYPDDFALARADFIYLSDDVLRVKIYDAQHKRWEVPVPDIPVLSGTVSKLNYRVVVDSSSVGFKVIRNIDNVTIINTQDVGAMILSNKFLQISAILPTEHIFGFGEHYSSFKRDINWLTMTMFNADGNPKWNKNQYGTHPIYLAVETSGNSHGMLLLNSNAMDVVLQPTPAVTYRTVGGILDLVIFMGPSPREVVAQYTGVVGRPFMPPYWSLGFHLCKYGYWSLNTTRHVWQTNRDAGIPFDVQWNDIDYMDKYNDFTYDPVQYAGLPEFVNEVHSQGMHYIAMFDPGVSGGEKAGTYPPYERGIEMDIFVKNRTGQPYAGKVWNTVSTVFPDFTHPNSTAYWLEMMSGFHNKVPYDGAWLDMNEPSNPMNSDAWNNVGCAPENIPYKFSWIKSDLSYYTLCMDVKHHLGPHYDLHNLYSITESIATHHALKTIRKKRPFVISRATFPGQGRYTGSWSGDMWSTWENMRMSILNLLSHSLFGIPMMGSDICGFGGDTNEELCRRWSWLGAFYPFARNHADVASKPQDPASLGPAVVEANIKALRLRYRVLPYLYTLFWRAHVYGDTVVTPLFFDQPNDNKLYGIKDQFLLGPNIMVTPILHENQNTTSSYFPGPQKWYNLVSGEYLASGEAFTVSEDQMISVKGGAIIPEQEPPAHGPVTTSNSRSGPMQLLVAPNNDNCAAGHLYWDDGDSLNSYEEKMYSQIEFTLKDEELHSTVTWWGYGVPSINNVTVLGQSYPVKSVSLNGVACAKPHCEFAYVGKTKTLNIFNMNLPLDKPFSIKWTH